MVVLLIHYEFLCLLQLLLMLMVSLYQAKLKSQLGMKERNLFHDERLDFGEERLLAK